MYAQVIWEAVDQFSVLNYKLKIVVVLFALFVALDKIVYLRLWQSKYFCKFTNNGTKLKGDIGAHQCGMGEAFKNISGNIVPVLPGKVDVKIGGRGTVQIYEPLKIEVQLNRVHIGNAKDIGHHAIGATATTYII